MSNADSIPRPEGAEGQNPSGDQEAPDSDAAARPADEGPAAPAGPAPAPGSIPEPSSSAPPAESAPAPASEPAPNHAGATNVMYPSGHHAAPGAPQMSAPGPWQPTGPPAGPPYGQGGAALAQPKRGRGKLVAGAIALALIAGAAGGVAGWFLNDGEGSTTVVESVSMDAGSGMTYTEIAETVSPSVVAIVTNSAEGSGVVYSDDGYIITNNHVVQGARTVEVRFSDGTVAEAEVVATDATQDLAVVQVSGVDNLAPITFGDSEALSVGDATVAIGSPLGLQGTVTTGIVSALDRSMSISGEDSGPGGASTSESLAGLIQTDAAINMGNSGGALVNGNGELIGINTAIASTESGSIGLGFAIPSNTVKDVADQLIENGSVEQGYLGVSLSDTQGNGAMILEVEADSPAADAGLAAGDVITEIDGTQVTSASEVVAAVQTKASGDQISITYIRDNQEQTTEATLVSR